MGLLFSGSDPNEDWTEYWKFREKWQQAQTREGETKKQFFIRAIPYLIKELNYSKSKAKHIARIFWRCYVYKKENKIITPDDFTFPTQFYLKRNIPKSEIVKERKLFREKKVFQQSKKKP